MNDCKNIIEYCGESEWGKIGRYVKCARKHYPIKSEKEEPQAIKQALLRLNGSKIRKKTFYVIVRYLIMGDENINLYPSDDDFNARDTVPWRSISNMLTRYCGVGVEWGADDKLEVCPRDKYYCLFYDKYIYTDYSKPWVA